MEIDGDDGIMEGWKRGARLVLVRRGKRWCDGGATSAASVRGHMVSFPDTQDENTRRLGGRPLRD